MFGEILRDAEYSVNESDSGDEATTILSGNACRSYSHRRS